MPDEKVKEEKAEKPNLLVDLVKAATEKKESSGSKSGSSFVVYLIIVGVAVLGFSIMGLLLVSARRKAAKLAYELRKKEEEQKRAAEDHKLAKSGEERNAAHKKVKALEGDIQGLKEELQSTQEVAKKRRTAIEQATSWDDLVVVDKRE